MPLPWFLTISKQLLVISSSHHSLMVVAIFWKQWHGYFSSQEQLKSLFLCPRPSIKFNPVQVFSGHSFERDILLFSWTKHKDLKGRLYSLHLSSFYFQYTITKPYASCVFQVQTLHYEIPWKQSFSGGHLEIDTRYCFGLYVFCSFNYYAFIVSFCELPRVYLWLRRDINAINK